MKCKNCGANYRTRELKCPYCGTENLLGRIWMAEVSDAEIAFERERAEAKRGLPLFVMNRVVNRVLVLLVVLFFILMLAFGIVDGSEGLGYLFYDATHKEEIESTLQDLYKNGKWSELYTYMSDRKLFSTDEDYYAYSQAAFLANSYKNFLDHKYAFYQMSEEEKMSDDYELENLIRWGSEALQLDFGIYDEPQKVIEDSEEYKNWKADIESCWRGYLGMSDDEVSWLLSGDVSYSEEMDAFVTKIRERQAWKQEVTADEN